LYCRVSYLGYESFDLGSLFGKSFVVLFNVDKEHFRVSVERDLQVSQDQAKSSGLLDKLRVKRVCKKNSHDIL
jgi:hypothetical protein